MARNLDFKAVEHQDDVAVEDRSWRRRREANPTIQMSVRMREDIYERFRSIADRERRTNGDMLELMMASYLREQGKSS